MKITTIIYGGGLGTRLRPLTTPTRPKAVLDLVTGNTQLDETLNRAFAMGSDKYIVATPDLIDAIITKTKNENLKFITEPELKGTAGVVKIVMSNADFIANTDVLIFAPVDHYIPNIVRFSNVILNACKKALKGNIVLIGASALNPDTDKGYILNTELGVEFFEKPDKDTVNDLIKAGAWWNTGIIVSTPDTLKTQLDTICPGYLTEPFSDVLPHSIDKLLLERSTALTAHLYPDTWMDIGTPFYLYQAIIDYAVNNGNTQVSRVYVHNIPCLLYKNYLITKDNILNLSPQQTKQLKTQSKPLSKTSSAFVDKVNTPTTN